MARLQTVGLCHAVSSGRQGGRTLEIQRLIGRSLRAVVDLSSFGERTITLDCDVIEADGGTRTAAINGASVALHGALKRLVESGASPYHPMRDLVAAVSVGIVSGQPCLDLDFAEDSAAGVDMNVVMTGAGQFVEVQGTAESAPFSEKELQAMLQCISKLPERMRHVVRSLLDGSRSTALAGELGTSTAAIYQLQYRALGILRECIVKEVSHDC